ncbi:TetR/AcrR family transcriptional regulator [Luminiphilus sp.]|nr:TetR/AcrR family transcriptional regulator [Luminiphilus sp.]
MNTTVSSIKRARTPAQKSDRKDTILLTAKAQFLQTGYEGFSMAVLAQRAGVAKGTLYLYFGTKEEVLMSLYNSEFDRLCATLVSQVTPGFTDRDFINAVYRASITDPVFLALHARLSTVIEHNISIAALIASKRGMLEQFNTLIAAIAEHLDLSHTQTMEAFSAFSALLTGCFDGHAPGLLEREAIPDDVAHFIDLFNMERRFKQNAYHILQGIRSVD